MPDASPVKWHLAHTTWFFEVMVLRQARPDAAWFDETFNYLFNSYYNTVGKQFSRPHRGLITRPTVAEVTRYREHIDQRMLDFMGAASDDVWARHADVIELEDPPLVVQNAATARLRGFVIATCAVTFFWAASMRPREISVMARLSRGPTLFRLFSPAALMPGVGRGGLLVVAAGAQAVRGDRGLRVAEDQVARPVDLVGRHRAGEGVELVSAPPLSLFRGCASTSARWRSAGRSDRAPCRSRDRSPAACGSSRLWYEAS
ncbi:MAG: hypothetical protein HC794_06435 [Nitrospiraceae bacterium]|nr:hypothetical protein [Nitrospiraceae bacterium]